MEIKTKIIKNMPFKLHFYAEVQINSEHLKFYNRWIYFRERCTGSNSNNELAKETWF